MKTSLARTSLIVSRYRPLRRELLQCLKAAKSSLPRCTPERASIGERHQDLRTRFGDIAIDLQSLLKSFAQYKQPYLMKKSTLSLEKTLRMMRAIHFRLADNLRCLGH